MYKINFWDVLYVKEYIEKRALLFAGFIIDNNATVRDTAKKFDISKSTVHKDVTQRLKKIDVDLYDEVRSVLNKNKAERHIRGGLATKLKYENENAKRKNTYNY